MSINISKHCKLCLIIVLFALVIRYADDVMVTKENTHKTSI